MTAHAAMPLFTRPRIAMQEREDGCLLLSSADPLQDYPGTVLHSLSGVGGSRSGLSAGRPARR